MNDVLNMLLRQEYRAAKRLARLFRVERTGRLARCPPELAARLVERRGGLVRELEQFETRRRSLMPWTDAALDLAMGRLAREVRLTEQYCLGRLAELGAELERRRGGSATGLRAGAAGRLLGRV